MNGFITPIDVAARLLRSHRIWFHGKPKVSLEGEDLKFGKLCFDFGDEVVRYGIYIHDREVILGAAEMAVENFDILAEEIWGE